MERSLHLGLTRMGLADSKGLIAGVGASPLYMGVGPCAYAKGILGVETQEQPTSRCTFWVEVSGSHQVRYLSGLTSVPSLAFALQKTANLYLSYYMFPPRLLLALRNFAMPPCDHTASSGACSRDGGILVEDYRDGVCACSEQSMWRVAEGRSQQAPRVACDSCCPQGSSVFART